MGSNEADPPAKASKSSAAREQTSVTSVRPATSIYPDWSIFQAFSPIPPAGFFHSAVASSHPPHPYVWGAQHLLPPFGAPPPYVMYPHGEIYAHPSMAPACSNQSHVFSICCNLGSHPFSLYAMAPNGNGETSGAVPGSRESKQSDGSLNLIIGKNSEFGKTSGASGNEAYSQSGDSGSEASSEGSDAESQNGSLPKAGDHQNSSDAGRPGTQQNGNPTHTDTGHGSQNGITCAPSQPVLGHAMSIIPVTVAAVPGAITSPTTNLNIGMGFRSATNSSLILPNRGKIPSTAVPTTLAPGAPSELWMQDESELRRKRRKQSNRESARRSRLRKQAECDELAHRVEVLKEENASLRAEVSRIKGDYEQLLTQNTTLKESIVEIPKGTEELIHGIRV